MNGRKKIWYLIPLLGTIGCIFYIAAATRDVVYSDYIRLVNSYLPDVGNPEKFFVADILTRIPVNFLGRIVNTALFGYSTTFDMVLGVLCLGASAVVLTAYCQKRKIGFSWYLLLMFLLFSLNKWEMLTNGTGWCHFLAFWGFYYHYLVWDRVWVRCRQKKAKLLTPEEKKQDKRDRLLLCLLPWTITLGTAGPYCGAYSAVLILIYGICFFVEWKEEKKPDRRIVVYGLHVLFPLLLYLFSNAFAVQEYAGATGRSLVQVLGDNAGLFPKFLIKSLASMVLGEEVLMTYLTKLNRGMAPGYLAGLLIAAGYLLALWMQVKNKLYKDTVFPLMFILWGGLNHLLVLSARWIFEKSSYGMSSRYALQYQVGIFGMLLTFALVEKQHKTGKKDRRPGAVTRRAAMFIISGVLLLGNLCTTWKEIKTAPYRKAYAEEVIKMALHYREVPDDELEDRFQYHHGPEKIRRALGILEEQGWNVYRKQAEGERKGE